METLGPLGALAREGELAGEVDAVDDVPVHVLAALHRQAPGALDAEALDGALLRAPLGRPGGLPVAGGQVSPAGLHDAAVALGGRLKAIGEEPLHEGGVLPLRHGGAVVDAVDALLQVAGEGLVPQGVLHGPGAGGERLALL